MSIWDTLRRLLGQKPKPATTSQQNERFEPSSTVVLAAETDPDNDLPTPGDVPVDLFTLLFNSNDKHQTTMLNSISLSTDMKTLYLIDNGRAIPFDLTVPEGVLVGLLGEQLVVATGVSAPGPLTDEPIGDGTTTPAPTLGNEPEPASEAKSYSFKTGENSQFTLTYNGKNEALGIIGVDDIILHLTHPDDQSCSKVTIKISEGKVVKIKKLEDEIVVEKI